MSKKPHSEVRWVCKYTREGRVYFGGMLAVSRNGLATGLGGKAVRVRITEIPSGKKTKGAKTR